MTLDDLIVWLGCDPACDRYHGSAGTKEGQHYRTDHSGGRWVFALDDERVEFTRAKYAKRHELVRSGQQSLGLED